MPKYTGFFINVTSVGVPVEADTPDLVERIAADALPGGLCQKCSDDRSEGDWEFHSVEDADGEVVLKAPPMGAGGLAAVLAKHIAETVTQGDGNDVVVDCACGAEIRGALPDVDSPTGAIMAVMAPHLAEVAASYLV